MTGSATDHRSRLTPAAVRAVADVAAARYATPGPSVRFGPPPVTTTDGDRVRLESLSACGSVYARLDRPAEPADPATGSVPVRWTRGFAEATVVALDMMPVADVDGPAAARFLGTLPMFGAPGPDVELAVARNDVRRVLGYRSGSVPLAGCGRLRAAVHLAPAVTRMRLGRSPSGATSWVFDLPEGRLTLLLSARVHRGFGARQGAHRPTR